MRSYTDVQGVWVRLPDWISMAKMGEFIPIQVRVTHGRIYHTGATPLLSMENFFPMLDGGGEGNDIGV